jgi:hypothetical protein
MRFALGLLLCSSLGPGALAQPAPPVAPGALDAADRGARPARAPPETGIISTPRFFVEALSFHAHNETGFDFPGADEVVAVFDTPQYRLITDYYEDVDTGETKFFRSQHNCVLPATDPGAPDLAWSCIEAGAPGPISFTVALYEYDGPLPLGDFCIDAYPPNDLYPHQGEPCRIKPEFSDLIGKDRVDLSMAQLLAAMPRSGDTHTGSVLLFGGCDAVAQPGCTAGGTFGPDPEYRVTYRVTRVGNQVETPPREVVHP